MYMLYDECIDNYHCLHGRELIARIRYRGRKRDVYKNARKNGQIQNNTPYRHLRKFDEIVMNAMKRYTAT